jgi:uncharacterized membrane protein (UPF0127 family)
MKKILLVAVLLSLTAVSCNKSTVLAQDKILQLKQFKITVQLADTPEKRAQGLSGIKQITDNEGMLFLFSEPQRPAFWMKGMNFPLDIIWIHGDTIVGISDNVKPMPNTGDDSLPKYYPPQDSDKVLEVNGGWAFRHDVNVGDKVIDLSTGQ